MALLNNVFDKNVSAMAKTLAMILMLTHHLWTAKSVGGGYLLAGQYGKICVGIFMFISGFGLMASYMSGRFRLATRLKRTIFPFWFVMLVALPIVAHWRDLSGTEVLMNAALLSKSINGSWWFMQTYLIFVAAVPLFARSLRRPFVWIPLLAVSLISFQPIGTWIRPYSDDIHYIFHYFPVFFSGMIACKYRLFDRLAGLRLPVMILMTVALFAVRLLLDASVWNIGIIVSLLMWMTVVNTKLNVKARATFTFLGGLAIYMWLIHQFFIDYSIHFDTPIADLLWMYLQTLLAAYIVSKLYGLANKLISKLKR